METQKRFLKSGKQTEITERIRNVAASIGGDGLDYVANALRWPNEKLERRGFLWKNRDKIKTISQAVSAIEQSHRS